MNRSFLIFLMLHCSFFYIKAQVPSANNYSLQRLDNRNGLSNSCINYVFQDSDNLLWLATWDGLNVYDGSDFHVYNYSKENISKSIGNNVILQILEDKRGCIWIGTVEGVSRFDKKSGKFYNYFYNRTGKNKVTEQEFILAINKDGELYASAKKYGKGIYKYNVGKDTFIHDDLPIKSRVVKMEFDQDENLWLLTADRRLEVYTKRNNHFIIRGVYGDKGSLEAVNSFFCANGQIFYQAADKKLYQIHSGLQARVVLLLPEIIQAMTCYKEHYIFSRENIGYDIYDKDFKRSDFLRQEMRALQNMQITTLKTGTEKTLWLGTDGDGILKISEKESFFGMVKGLPEILPYNKAVRTFFGVGQDLWVGTKGNGILVIPDFLKNKSLQGIRNLRAPTHLDDNAVFALESDQNGLIYIGTNGRGVTLYDPQEKQFIKWDAIKGTEKYPDFKSVYAILKDEDGSVWMGTNWFGLIHLKLKRSGARAWAIEYLKQYHFNGSDTGPGNDIIYTLAAGNNDRLWVGCRYGGLSLFDKKEGKFKTFRAFTYKGSLSNNDVLSLFKDPQQRLWVGTSYGLNWMNESDAVNKNPVFKKLTVDNGLPNNTIHAITMDSSGHVWVSTNKGLAKIDPVTLDVVRFKDADGLQSNEFSDGAVWKNNTGYLFFGGIYGFNYFLPDQIKMKQAPANLLLSNLELAGDPVKENGLPVVKANQPYVPASYALGRNDNYFELVLKGISFSNIEKCRYAYLLEGNDKEWKDTGEDGKIAYTNIPPGKYKLKVKWSNGEGTWTKEVIVLDLEIRQYLWLTAPAFFLYFILVLLSIYAFYIYRRNKTAMRHKLDIEQRLRIKDEEVHKEQQNFFTNITHELQTPLTLILGALERFMQKNKRSEESSDKQFLSLVHQQASRLSYLVQQLLEFRRVKEGYHRNYYSELNVSELLINIADLFKDLKESKSLSYSVNIEPDIRLWTDKDKLEKIIFNLLSNAFKHSAHHQEIIFNVRTDVPDDALLIEVANSGCDLQEKELDQLFDKFFVKDDTRANKVSSGIGLAFTRELVKLLNGSIAVKCEEGWITFQLKLGLSFVPEQQNILTDPSLKLDTPSHLIRSVAGEAYPDAISIEENNKQALIASFEQEDKKTILIVEDEPAIRFLLKDILSDAYILYEAGNGTEALEVVKNIIPNLIISDVMMPDMSGLELCTLIKNTPDTCHVPFIMLTARGTAEQKVEGYDSGADAYISKPFNIDHLRVRIRKLIEYRQKLHDLFAADQIHQPIAAEGLKDADKQLISNIVRLVEDNIENIDLDATFLEEQLALSKMQLYRRLKSLSNMTPNELIRSIRLQKAAALLQSSDLTVSEIFYRTGFNHQSYFYREFKRRYQYSPNDYRKKLRVTTDRD